MMDHAQCNMQHSVVLQSSVVLGDELRFFVIVKVNKMRADVTNHGV